MKLEIFSKVYSNYELEIALHKINAQDMSIVQFNFANVGLASLLKKISQGIILQIKETTINSGVSIAVISGTYNTLELNEEKKAFGLMKQTNHIRRISIDFRGHGKTVAFGHWIIFLLNNSPKM